MTRRTRLPAAEELRTPSAAQGARAVAPGVAAVGPLARLVTAVQPPPEAAEPVEDGALDDGAAGPRAAGERRRPRPPAVDRRPSGRERHDEKITVYVSADELLDLEHARLALRGEHGLAVDRGRIVREALAVVLADLDAHGEASVLVQRLRGR